MAKKKAGKRGVTDKKLGGPYLGTALLCENVLREENGVQSIIRIIDTFTIERDPQDATPSALQTTSFVVFKAGGASGRHEAIFTLVGPDEKKRVIAKGYLDFESEKKGAHSGVSLQTPMLIRLAGPGTYWIELRLEGKLYTKIPLKINFRKPTPD